MGQAKRSAFTQLKGMFLHTRTFATCGLQAASCRRSDRATRWPHSMTAVRLHHASCTWPNSNGNHKKPCCGIATPATPRAASAQNEKQQRIVCTDCVHEGWAWAGKTRMGSGRTAAAIRTAVLAATGRPLHLPLPAASRALKKTPKRCTA